MTADETRLTELVREAADGLEPADRLSEIRASAVADLAARRRRTWLVTGGASLAAAAAVTAVAFAVAPGVDRATGPDPGTPGGSNAPTTIATDPATPDSEQPSENPTGPGGTAIPVYYVGDTPRGQRLYREFTASTSENPALEAARAATEGTPDDPDYRSLWGADVIEDVVAEGADGELRIVLRADFGADPLPAMSAEDAQLAVQALVYTVQGVEQSMAPVTFWLNDRRVDSLLGLDVSEPVTRAPQLDVLAGVNVSSPEQGAVVADGTLEISGVASSFENNVPWTIQDEAGTAVDFGALIADGDLGRMNPWSGVVNVAQLPAGDYTFVATTDDPSGGTEGWGPFEDTKTFTIE